MKIRGNTIGIPNPQPDWNQTDSTQADYIKNKPGNYVTISPNPPESAPTLWFKPDEYVYTEEAVKTWGELEERVTALEENTGAGGGGGSVELDTTLTQSGKAADAKAVGDALAELEGKIPEGGEEVDLSGYAQKSELPTKVSQLQNDVGYLTQHQDISGKLDASALPTAINTALAQAKASGEFDGKDGQDGSPGKDGAAGKDGVSATHSWSGTTLTVTSASGTSSANLKGDKGDKGDTGGTGAAGASVTVKSVSESTADGGSNVVTFSDGKTLTVKNGSKGSTGSKGDKGDKGDTGATGAAGVSPTVSVSKSGKVTTIEITDADGTETVTINDGADGTSGSATIADGSITPEKTSFIVCEGSGEDVTTRVPNFTNRADPKSSDWKTDTRFSSSSGNQSALAGAIVTNAITAKVGDIIRIKGIKGGTGATANALFQIVGYTDAAGTTKTSSTGLLVEKTTAQSGNGISEIVQVADGVTTWTAYTYCSGGAAVQSAGFNGAVSFRVAGVPVTTVDDIIITVNEPITYTEVTSGGKTYTLSEDIIVPHAAGLKSGAKWFALGDSITEGYVSAVDSSASSGYKQYLNTNEAERWVNIVAQKNGYELTNYGVGGTGYAHSSNNVRKQVATIDFSKCDFVTLAYGVNDWKGKATLGSMEDDVDTVDAFVPNMRYAIKKILADNPYCKIFVITPLNCRSLGYYDTNWGIGYTNADNASGPGLEQIFQLEKTVCEYHGIELIDMTHCSIINRENIKTMLPDYVHPTVKCHAVMARELAKKIAFQ